MDNLPGAHTQLAEYIMDTCDRITVNQRLTISELQAFLPTHPFTKWLAAGRLKVYDSDHDGCLSMEELQIACSHFLEFKTDDSGPLSPGFRRRPLAKRWVKEDRSPFLISARDKANALLMNSGYVGGLAFDRSGLVKKHGGCILQEKGMHKLTKTALDDMALQCEPFQNRCMASRQQASRSKPLTSGRKSAARIIVPEMRSPSPADRAARAVSREQRKWAVLQSRQQQQAAKEWSKAELLCRAKELPVVLAKYERDNKQDVGGLMREVRDTLKDAHIPPLRRHQIEAELNKMQKSAPGTARRLRVWLEYLNTKVAEEDNSIPTGPAAPQQATNPTARNKRFDNMRTQDQELWPVSLSRDIHDQSLETDSIGTVNYTTSVSLDTNAMETHNMFGTSPLPAQIFMSGFCQITNH